MRYWDRKINEDEMGGTCSTSGREEKCMQIFCMKTGRKEAVWKIKSHIAG
jgi:hypothetical protein